MVLRIAMIGKKFGRLLVLKEAVPYISPSGKAYAQWLCLCNCGKEVVVQGSYLRSGHTKSCGCYHIERSTVHGKSNTSEFDAWCSLRSRCGNPSNLAYHNYGGRGIKVCQWWLNSFENFLEDMGRRPGPKYSIDRENNDGNYEPGNCRWATSLQQNLNARGVGIFMALTPMGEVITAKGITKFARDNELQQTCISLCLAGKQKQHKGWKFKRLEGDLK